MKAKLTVFFSIAALSAGAANAAILVNESWAGYTDNANLNTQAVQSGTGLSGTWAVTSGSAGLTAQNGAGETLSYTYGSTTVTSNIANPGNAYQDPIASATIATPLTSKDIYFRYTFAISAHASATAGTDIGIWMNFGTSEKVGWYSGVGPTTPVLFVGTAVGGGTTATISGGLTNNNNVTTGAGVTSYTDNSPNHLILGKIAWNGTAYDKVSLYLDPTTGLEADFTSLTKIVNASFSSSFASVDTLSLGFEDVRTGSATAAQRIGQVTLAESWVDLGITPVPEPSTALLGGLGLLALLRRRRA